MPQLSSFKELCIDKILICVFYMNKGHISLMTHIIWIVHECGTFMFDITLISYVFCISNTSNDALS